MLKNFFSHLNFERISLFLLFFSQVTKVKTLDTYLVRKNQLFILNCKLSSHYLPRYQFPLVQTKVLEVIQLANDQRAVLLEKTCCYGESGGQAGDRGKISNLDDIEIMEINDTQLDAKNKNHVWHIGTLNPHRKLEPGSRVKVQFQVDRRIGLMQNHTGTHLLNCVLHQMFPFTRQTSSSVMPNEFKFEFISLNSNLGTDDVLKIGKYDNNPSFK